MQCPYCNDTLTQKDRCENCGQTVKKFKKLYHLSNRCYNEGLEKAKRRDLSGAVTALKNSLKMNKKNTEARNLLGLIYSETGDVVRALSEWVISTHFKKKDNEAEEYLSYYQTNPTRLDNANQVIKRYNKALQGVRNGNSDLAIIQLKRVISINPNHVKALQLLSLLYIKSRNYSQARKYLEMAIKIDRFDPMTISYLNELKESGGQPERQEEKKPERVMFADSDSFAPASSYKEDRPSILPWVNLVLGIVIGIAFFAIAVLPGIRAKSVEGKKAEIIALNETLASAHADVDKLKNESTELKRKLEDTEKKNEELLKSAKVQKAKENKSLSDNLIKAVNFFVMEEEGKAADTLVGIDREKIKDKDALNLYHQISAKVFEKRSGETFIEGRDLYNTGKYKEALKKLEASLKMNPENVDSMYFIGRTHDRLGDAKKAKEWYEKIINEYGGSPRAAEARQRLSNLGGN